MPISSKDAVGLALAAGTVVVLLVHGGDRHAPTPPDAVPPTVAPGNPPPPDVVAFVDVRLPGEADDPYREQVVVVRHGVVVEVAPAGSVELPQGALVVDCGGSSYLVAAMGRPQSPDRWYPVVPGTSADLVLLSNDPRRKPSDPDDVRGRLVDGFWLPAVPEAQRVGLTAGH